MQRVVVKVAVYDLFKFYLSSSLTLIEEDGLFIASPLLSTPLLTSMYCPWIPWSHPAIFFTVCLFYWSKLLVSNPFISVSVCCLLFFLLGQPISISSIIFYTSSAIFNSSFVTLSLLVELGSEKKNANKTLCLRSLSVEVWKLFVHLFQVILSMSSEAIMLGVTDREFQSGVVDFCQLLLRTGTL